MNQRISFSVTTKLFDLRYETLSPNLDFVGDLIQINAKHRAMVVILLKFGV